MKAIDVSPSSSCKTGQMQAVAEQWWQVACAWMRCSESQLLMGLARMLLESNSHSAKAQVIPLQSLLLQPSRLESIGTHMVFVAESLARWIKGVILEQ